MTINPIRLVGNWTEGYSMDVHTIRSIYLGVDEYGHSKYDTTRSEIGELLYQLKYKYKEEVRNEVANGILKKIEEFQSFVDGTKSISDLQKDLGVINYQIDRSVRRCIRKSI